MEIIKKMEEKIEARTARSAWGRGVKLYAFELLENLAERIGEEHRAPDTLTECKKWLLNGASDWAAYSWGGCSYIYDGDIAARLCCPSEFARCKGGDRRPNSREEWLDVQGRALAQAGKMAVCAFDACRRVDDDGNAVPF